QGTDLAMLIRRLRARLKTPSDHLICAGTSATLGGAEGIEPLCSYASQIFGSPFYVNSVVVENRKTVAEFLADAPIDHFLNWDDALVETLQYANYANQTEAVKAWFNLFFP